MGSEYPRQKEPNLDQNGSVSWTGTVVDRHGGGQARRCVPVVRYGGTRLWSWGFRGGGRWICECRVILGYTVRPCLKKELNETKPPKQTRIRKKKWQCIYQSRPVSVKKSHPGPTLFPATRHLNFMLCCYSEGLRVGLVGPDVTSWRRTGS